MNCYEYEGKNILQSHKIPVPSGQVVQSVEESRLFFQKHGGPCILKAQVLSGKRKKAGGIKEVYHLEEIGPLFDSLQGRSIYGEEVSLFLIEEKLDIKEEFYLGLTIHPSWKEPFLMFSLTGGIDIEEIAKKDQNELLQYPLLEGMMLYEFLDLFSPLNLPNSLLLELSRISKRLTHLFFSLDALTLEINPLVLTEKGLVAADAKMVLDDSALYRQKLPFQRDEDRLFDPLTERAMKHGLTYVPLEIDGTIGAIAGGAGLAMATMDIIHEAGARPANFLDIGGGVSAQGMAEALRIVLAGEKIEGIIVNVFGGINNCAIMAKGISKVFEERTQMPEMVVKMRGHSQEEGWRILEELNIPVVKYGTTEEAIFMLLKALKGGE